MADRNCAGRYFALNQLYSKFASVLHTFNITPALDVNGDPIPAEPRMTSGIVSYVPFLLFGYLVDSSFSYPSPFRCSIKPRSANAEALITEGSH